MVRPVGDSARRGRLSILLVVVTCASVSTIAAPISAITIPSGRTTPVVTTGQRCTKKFDSIETKFMCLPRARGTGLTWQKFPKEKYSCPRSGLYAKSAGLVCRKYSSGFHRASAALSWITPPGPFRYFTIYGNSWQPKRGRECALHNTVVEWELFQAQWQGTASCLPDSTGVVWRWQSAAQIGKSCVRAAVQWGNLVCAKSGGRLRWTKAAKSSRSVDDVVAEARELFAHISSMGFKRSTDQYPTYHGDSMESFPNGNGISGAMIREFQLRAALAGVTVVYPFLSVAKHLIVVKWSAGQRCFALPETSYWNEELDPGGTYQGSLIDVPEIECNSSQSDVHARALVRVEEIDRALWSTNDVRAWHAGVISLGSDPTLRVIQWKWLGRSNIDVDVSSWDFGIKADVTVNRSVSPAVPVSTTYKFNDKCFAGARSGSSGTFSEVPCA